MDCYVDGIGRRRPDRHRVADRGCFRPVAECLPTGSRIIASRVLGALDYSLPFLGYDYYIPKMEYDKLDELEEILGTSLKNTFPSGGFCLYIILALTRITCTYSPMGNKRSDGAASEEDIILPSRIRNVRAVDETPRVAPRSRERTHKTGSRNSGCWFETAITGEKLVCLRPALSKYNYIRFYTVDRFPPTDAAGADKQAAAECYQPRQHIPDLPQSRPRAWDFSVAFESLIRAHPVSPQRSPAGPLGFPRSHKTRCFLEMDTGASSSSFCFLLARMLEMSHAKGPFGGGLVVIGPQMPGTRGLRGRAFRSRGEA